MSQKSYIKCLECNTLNLNTDYCKNCGSIINITLKRNLEREKKIQKNKELEKANKPNKIDEFLQSSTEHPNGIVRMFSRVVYAMWLFFAAVVGGLIAAVIAIAAG
ncbi:MAG: hypothetical protein ACI7YS_03695 [Flavobacterium sp.]